MFHKNEKGNMERATHAGVTPFKVESGNNYDFTVSIAKKNAAPDCELTLYLLARGTNVNFNFTPKKVGRYLFFLTERYNNAMLGYFAIYFTGETNAIRTVSIQQATDAPTFDLQGRRVGHQPHGIVIQNGKKYLRK